MLVNPPPCRSQTSGINLKENGTPVAGGPFTTLNFVNATVVNNGGGQATITCAGSGGSSLQELTDIHLNPTGNPQIWTTPHLFFASSLALYHNGRRMERSVEYTIFESGGPGTGFDSIQLITLVLNQNSRLLADYVPFTPSTTEQTDIALIPTGNPQLWKTPSFYLTSTLAVYHNGHRLERNLEYVCEESAGPATGFDQIRLLSFVPNVNSRLRCDYLPA